MMSLVRHPASFRDPSGSVYWYEGRLLRTVSQSYAEDYDQLMSSGLYEELTRRNLLIPHDEFEQPNELGVQAHRVLAPQPVPFVSYPYEWPFSALKDAALVTLQIQQIALQYDMSLKDASAYNVQFIGPQPTLIDTLSFERYEVGQPWVAYRQFCRHFLAPLALMAYRDPQLGLLARHDQQGVPLDLAARLLPKRTWLRPGLLLHVHLHASSQRRGDSGLLRAMGGGRKMSRQGLRGLIDGLRSVVEAQSWEPEGTQWSDYEETKHHYSASATEAKERLVLDYLRRAQPQVVWDLGANVGHFSRVAASVAEFTLALDSDPAAVERNYLRLQLEDTPGILPLVADLANPTPGLGWRNRERDALLERGPADAALALALVHHLAIGNNLPLDSLADFFADLTVWLVLEFVPKSDPQVQRLLVFRKDIFPSYNREIFERVFARRFHLLERERLPESQRALYLMRRRDDDELQRI